MCFTNLPLPCELNTINPYMPKKKSKNISFPRYSKFLYKYRDSRVAQDLDQAKTSAMNSQICLF